MTNNHPTSSLNTINLVTQCLCIPIVTIFVATRFAIRCWYKQFVVVEDTFCLLAWILFMVYCAIAIIIGQYGGGIHYTEVPPEWEVPFKKFCYIATVFYCPMILFVKYALLSILIRIFAPYRARIMFIYGLLGCLTIYYIIAEIVKIRMCDPVPAYWTGQPASCLDQRAALIADSVISAVTDAIILVLPLPLTWSLQMSRSKKMRVIGMLSAGGLATAFSIYRLILVLRDGSSPNMTVMFTCVILSGNAEGGVGLICACLPTMNIVINKIRQAGYSYGSNKYNQNESSMHLSKMKGASSKGFSAIGSRTEPEFGSDQSHLITYAGTVDVGSAGDGGIHKTIDVSQTVEVLGNEPAQRSQF
ncbi:hypothetical protein ETB97_004433 [Aspergillus alliaceus]|uniref:Rhodopsin domain-containing protein n=1 Tax=Petromyces alliaceus TaxID=209559 RepID=A0A5N7CBJ0_PETAA|nr:uncharacterized protein BDW43DRAFT_282657 [Aspergillus alliaceus]KAB8231269.1 hypothetical protein BDW43DRAFT_282657 [Aspergillus alliaceus]KAE8391512.1 hypothetical protein BDV23DRAFT_153181 [Aspergillus alliaceus]KAF5858393.1 hypothetical protein ETB97_004433 [Aspergillus burnettii]